MEHVLSKKQLPLPLNMGKRKPLATSSTPKRARTIIPDNIYAGRKASAAPAKVPPTPMPVGKRKPLVRAVAVPVVYAGHEEEEEEEEQEQEQEDDEEDVDPEIEEEERQIELDLLAASTMVVPNDSPSSFPPSGQQLLPNSTGMTLLEVQAQHAVLPYLDEDGESESEWGDGYTEEELIAAKITAIDNTVGMGKPVTGKVEKIMGRPRKVEGGLTSYVIRRTVGSNSFTMLKFVKMIPDKESPGNMKQFVIALTEAEACGIGTAIMLRVHRLSQDKEMQKEWLKSRPVQTFCRKNLVLGG
jgi:hypothetical protein